jgi:hypothetical protein
MFHGLSCLFLIYLLLPPCCFVFWPDCVICDLFLSSSLLMFGFIVPFIECDGISQRNVGTASQLVKKWRVRGVQKEEEI